MASRSYSWNVSMGRRSYRQHRSWPSMSFSQVWESHVFNTMSGDTQEKKEEELIWAAIERLPTFDRMRKGVLNLIHDDGKIVQCPIDVTDLGVEDKKLLLESMIKCVEDDNEKFLRGLQDRVNRFLPIYVFFFTQFIHLKNINPLCFIFY